ncbi:MAG TPA: AmmeMemoRadiSam system protein B [Xanthomonadales bacterium]|nr:AmmeMemoRadiSam system protein B [Xanthomonadales bacterium]
MIRIREAAVAGSFYPADSGELHSMVHRMLDAAAPDAGPAPKALIVPHAGLVYSGPVAAAAYSRLRPYRSRYRRVVLLGPSHCVAFRGLAASSAEVFRTPLGDVPVARAALDALRHDAVSVIDAAHRAEHCLEVQLPFLQSLLGAFEMLPLVVGDARAADVASVLDLLWGGPETLLVISSDLSHYLPYGQARERDRATCDAIEALDAAGIDAAQACGAAPLRGLLVAAGRRGLHPRTLDLRNSGDTSGSRGRVVGYGAWILTEEHSCRDAA